MGYEIELLVGTVHENMKGFTGDSKDKPWLQIHANVDMRKYRYSGNLHKLNDNTTAPPVYMFAIMGDGDTPVVEDRYGKELTPIPIQDVINALRMDAKTDVYRRINWALALLEAMARDTDDLYVVLWGY